MFVRAIALRKQNLREYMNETSHLKNKVSILYDGWLTDPAYRRLIALSLGVMLPADDIGTLATEATEGGGRSFRGSESATRRRVFSDSHSWMKKETNCFREWWVTPSFVTCAID